MTRYGPPHCSLTKRGRSVGADVDRPPRAKARNCSNRSPPSGCRRGAPRPVEKGLADRGRPRVVRHVAPEESSSGHPFCTTVFIRPQISAKVTLSSSPRSLMARSSTSRTGLAGESMPPVRSSGISEASTGPDRLVPTRDEIVPDRFSLSRNRMIAAIVALTWSRIFKRGLVVLGGRVEEVVGRQGEHDQVRLRPKQVTGPVLRKEEQVRPDRSDRGELLPALVAAVVWVVVAETPSSAPPRSGQSVNSPLRRRSDTGQPCRCA